MTKSPRTEGQTVLGLDIGTNSIGWCLVEDKRRIIAAGVRVFEAGTTGTTDQIAAGKDEPRNAKRRLARQARRLLWRRARRLNSVFKRLVEWNLLPSCPAEDPEAKNRMFNELDLSLTREHIQDGDTQQAHLLPYILRRKGLDERLEPHAFGRAVFHLAQRRGFLSNRKSAMKEEEELGKVAGAIATLTEEMAAAGSRTLGEFFASLDPEKTRIRQRWTSRAMFTDEFDRLWAAQAPHHPGVLTEERRKRLRKTIFFQRPLKSQKHLIGRCDLEPGSPRAPWPLLEAQTFRLLQKLNDLRLKTPAGERELDKDERATLIRALETKGDLKFTEIKKLLGLSKSDAFNLQEGDEPKIPGNRTAAKVRRIIDSKWDDMTNLERAALVHDLMSIQNDDAFVRRAVKRWGLEEAQANELSRVGLEDGHCSLSLKAIRKLLARLESGTPYMTARLGAYPLSKKTAAPLMKLPSPPKLRNPIVERALTQVRKVVNALVGAYGKPDGIRVELARDLKRPRKLRALASKNNRDIQKEREALAKRIAEEAGIAQPKRSDIEKAMLWQECGGQCPYTGSSISFASLFGPNSQFDVEHIIPYSRSLDDSFLNKTLCHAAENRNRKRNMTPHEAYSSDALIWTPILQRVKAFKGRAADAKLRRFLMTAAEVQEAFESFSNRHLQDTRYASLEVARYLGTLFGCREDQAGVDADGTRRIQVSAGQVTALLRSKWGLNAVLDDGGQKNRGDHRHHAVDALVTALAEPGSVAALSAAAAKALEAKGRRFAPMTPPWPTLLDDARTVIRGINTSHAPSKKVSGPLHEEMFYSPPKTDKDGVTASHVRKRVGSLTKADLPKIVDPAVRDAVITRLNELGGDPKKAFADEKNHPTLPSRGGRVVPIHKVRVKSGERTLAIGAGPRRRHVKTGSNSHLEVFEAKDKKGNVYWDGRVVSLFEARQRIRARKPLVDRTWENRRFLLSISGGDIFTINDTKSRPQFLRARGISTLRVRGVEYPRVDFSPINDARKKDEIIKSGAWKTMLLEPLRKVSLRKLSFTAIGVPRNSNE